MEHNGDKYSTYILELVRNNGITDTNEENLIKPDTDGEVPYSFLLFDYFDTLYCKELCRENKKYLNYLSIENVFEDTIQHSKNYKVSYKTLSLYCKSENKQVAPNGKLYNIFSITDAGESLSEIPFLGLIQISLCKDNYIDQNGTDNIDIDAFLTQREEKILEIADKYLNEGADRQLFRSSTTGDFCLAVRTDQIRVIYDIAIALNGTQNDDAEHIKMLTFTNVGIECRYLQGKGYVTLDKQFVNSHSDIVIALRFSADKSIRNELQDYINKKNSMDDSFVRGLFGRYEYLLYIGLEEFAELYPYLCEKKFGRCVQDRKQSELEEIFKKSSIGNINERILVKLCDGTMLSEKGCIETDQEAISDKVVQEEISGEEKQKAIAKRGTQKEISDKEKQREILDKNRELFDRIKQLEKFKYFFHEEHFAFQDLIRGMKEIYKAFSSTGMDKESYINWCVFHKDMNILCECIEHMMKYYENWIENDDMEEADKKWYRGIVLGDWRNNLQAINRYTTLVQNVNYQTYQSPIYEIQTQIDTEKAMVAYREAMELYITGAIQWVSQKEQTDNLMVFPVIYPDLSKDTVEVAAPFMVKRPDGITDPDRIMPAREIICTVPSFEYFGRLYDLLPWILHETSHHLRVTERKERNRFVTKYIFSYIFDVVMREPLRQLSDCDFYKTFGKAEKYLIQSMEEVAEREIFEQKDFEYFNFEKLILEIDKWLKRMFPFGAEHNGKVFIGEEKQVKEKMFHFWLDAYRKEEMLDKDNLEKILHIWDGNENLKEKEELAEGLLKKYYENLCLELENQVPKLEICLNDVENYTQMEEKLAEIAKMPKEKKAFGRAYSEQIIALYRIMQMNLEEVDKNADYEKTEEYLKNVFDHYREHYKEKVKENNTVIDTVSMHIMRNLGLLNGDLKLFIKEMKEIFRNVNNLQIMEHKEIRQKIYLEAYADLLMATSLQFSSFGYCRQVLQTLSDAKLVSREHEYDEINYERWSVVTAVLLAEEGKAVIESEVNETVAVDATDLIENGKEYCRYTLKHIFNKLTKTQGFDLKEQDLEEIQQKKDMLEKFGSGEAELKQLEVKENELKNEKEAAENNRKLLKEFMSDMYAQIVTYIDGNESEVDYSFLLHILLQGDQHVSNKDIQEKWDKYKSLSHLCSDVKYNFWRIDCFCRGIGNIVHDGKITVSKQLFDHMRQIRKEAKDDGVQGCKWEKANNGLLSPKLDVGNFYNCPRQVYEKTPDQKLDNTIDFIQNYYYFNRFRVVNENKALQVIKSK